ncbi:MAG: endonuclease MutS2, partial [Acholeplasmataceae bacterium]|nr:endonuclease MutS2 [Acholeplasmataceae bacterium]
MFADTDILEYDRVLNEIKSYALTDMAKAEILKIRPINDRIGIVSMLEEVECAKTLIERYDETPMTGVLDVEDAIRRARIGSILSIEELLRVVSLVEAEQRTEKYIKKVRMLEIPSQILDHYYDALVTHNKIKSEIETAIDQKGYVVDNASPELAQIRKKLVTTEKRLNERMESLLNQEAAKLTDILITIRNNRLVLPVRAEYKNSVKGIVHDMSASKETLFIEPLACVDLNNQLQTLSIEEQEAISRILYRLSQTVAGEADSLINNIRIFTGLDIIFAKAKRAIEKKEEKVEITDGEINLINARHPAIPSDVVVPNTIRFGNYRVIVITGPNTGGKTVALKTLGLLSLMVQSGFFIPVDKGSKTIVFDNILADIGDEQSIEQSLSTFSSHIKNIIRILKQITPRSLVLLDEIGSGTDPKEGASLAMSILDHLRENRVHAMVTTHYPELKIYAYNLEDTVNASVEFDIDSLKPTFKLQIGIPGTSNAIDIASRLGLEKSITNHAREVSLTFDNATTNLIKKLEQQYKDMQKELEAIEILKSELERQTGELAKQKADGLIKQNRIIKDLEQKKQAEIKAAKEQAMVLIAELDQLKKQALFKEHELAKLKHQVKKIDGDQPEYAKTNTTVINIGDTVNVIPYQRIGIIRKKRNDHEFEVQMGALTGVFSEDDLE